MAITATLVVKHDLKLICEHRERMFAESRPYARIAATDDGGVRAVALAAT